MIFFNCLYYKKNEWIYIDISIVESKVIIPGVVDRGEVHEVAFDDDKNQLLLSLGGVSMKIVAPGDPTNLFDSLKAIKKTPKEGIKKEFKTAEKNTEQLFEKTKDFFQKEKKTAKKKLADTTKKIEKDFEKLGTTIKEGGEEIEKGFREIQNDVEKKKRTWAMTILGKT